MDLTDATPREKLLIAERNRLARFAALVLRDCPETDLDGLTMRQYAVDCGLMQRVPVAKPCGEACACADFGSGFPSECFRPTPMLQYSRLLEASQHG